MKKYLPIMLSASLVAFSSMSFAEEVPVTTDTFGSYGANGKIAVFSGTDSIESSGIQARTLSDALQSVEKQKSVNNDSESKINDLTNRISQLESKSSTQDSKIDRLERSLDEMKRSSDSLSNQVKDLSSKMK